jgi:hypothetical protein
MYFSLVLERKAGGKFNGPGSGRDGGCGLVQATISALKTLVWIPHQFLF